jgi:hypothetical protein
MNTAMDNRHPAWWFSTKKPLCAIWLCARRIGLPIGYPRTKAHGAAGSAGSDPPMWSIWNATDGNVR